MVEIAIQVRSLTGDSVIISISPDKTVQDLKLLLLKRFPPAIYSPDFHLLLRGAKLGLESKIGIHSINSGEFLVLLPFIKKQTRRNQLSDPPTTRFNSRAPHKATVNLAQSQWSVMMRELATLCDTMGADNQTGDSFQDDRDNARGTIESADKASASCVSRKRKRKSNDDYILSILKYAGEDLLCRELCESFIAVLDSVECLSDGRSCNCMLQGKSGSLGNDGQSLSCACPPWLKKIIKAFTFLNGFSGLLQTKGRRVTICSVKDLLKRLSEYGPDVDMESVNHLSVLCPKVVSFVNYEEESRKSDNMLLIFNLTRENDGIPGTAGKQIPLPGILSALKRREALFKKNLREVLKEHMCQVNVIPGRTMSLEELLISVKEVGSLAHANKENEASKSSLGTLSSPSSQTHCRKSHPLSPVEMVEHLRKGIGSQGQIVHVEEIVARVASFTNIPDELSENARLSLKALGISHLYSHQADAIRASLTGKNVVVATMTSSGKSLCYNLPVLETMMDNMLACALYLFPTKALAQDQLKSLSSMTRCFSDNLNFGIYDGDTSQKDRTWLRDNARLLITNPDMLHMSILPFHRQFSRILSNLRFVVIDETHTYKGPFGCHVSFILRRLQRLCSHVYGSDPSFIFCTATSANPREHAMDLANLSTLELVQKDGSPSGPKSFILWNPPLRPRSAIGKNNGRQDSKDKIVVMRRSSSIMEVSCLLAEMVQHGLQCIAFCKTRKLCELVLSDTREILKDAAPSLVNTVGAYRSGYIAEDRRRIESELFSGKLRGIAATNALELGIDVGHIDVTLHLGFPGSVASLWQQAGRSGRRGKPSLSVYVAFEGPLDQYFMKYPNKLFRNPMECCHVDTQNQQVLRQHLLCAAKELPLSLIYDEKYFGSGLNNAIEALEKIGNLSSNTSRDSSARMWSYIGQEKMPSRAVNIRSIESERYRVIDKQRNEVLEEIEESKVFFQVYEGAVYMNQGNTYLVHELDLSSKTAICQRADLKYYTKIRDYTDIHVVGGDLAYLARASKEEVSRTTAQAHPCKITTTWFGFFRIGTKSNKIFDSVELSLPKYSYDSQAVWIRVPQSVKTAVEKQNLSFRAGLHAACHSVLNVVPLYIICSSSDLASECANPHDTRYTPERILLYDKHPGGSGLALQMQPIFSEMLNSALELLTSCMCNGEAGCPNCIQNMGCHEYNEVLNKEAAIMIIKGVLESEKLCFQRVVPDSSEAS